MLEKLPKLAYTDYAAAKQLFVQVSDYSFATVLCQRSDENKLQLLEYKSRKWACDVQSYTKEEKYALAIKEVMVRLFPLIYLIKKFQIITESLEFSVIAQNPDQQTPRVRQYLTAIASLTVEFKMDGSKQFQTLLDFPETHVTE